MRIVDDNPELLASLVFMLRCECYDVAACESAKAFLQGESPFRPGCLVLDVQMPEMTGLELQRLLNARGSALPVIFLTAHGTVDMAVATLHKSAADLEQKPVRVDRFLAAVALAVEHDRAQRGSADPAAIAAKLSLLSDREREIFREAAADATSRRIAEALGLSPRNVEHHRAAGLRKLGIRSAAEAATLFAEAAEAAAAAKN